MISCFFSAHTVKECCLFICNLYIEMSMEYLSLYHQEMSFKPLYAAVLNLMFLCGKGSLQFSLNKMKSFLTEHQADP